MTRARQSAAGRSGRHLGALRPGRGWLPRRGGGALALHLAASATRGPSCPPNCRTAGCPPRSTRLSRRVIQGKAALVAMRTATSVQRRRKRRLAGASVQAARQHRLARGPRIPSQEGREGASGENERVAWPPVEPTSMAGWQVVLAAAAMQLPSSSFSLAIRRRRSPSHLGRQSRLRRSKTSARRAQQRIPQRRPSTTAGGNKSCDGSCSGRVSLQSTVTKGRGGREAAKVHRGHAGACRAWCVTRWAAWKSLSHAK